MTDPAQQFIQRSRSYLTTEYLPKIRACLRLLSPADVWWRPHAEANSIGNLLLHLEGNLRQWLITGVGGAPLQRVREKEFAPEQELDPELLLERLARAVDEADTILAALDPRELQVQRSIQGREATGLDAVYHAVEHFAMHTGQIIYITRLRTGRDLGFYVVEDGVTRARWEGRARDL